MNKKEGETPPILSRDQAILYGGVILGCYAERSVKDIEQKEKQILIKDDGISVALFVTFNDQKTGLKVPYFASENNTSPGIVKPNVQKDDGVIDVQ